MPVLLHYSTKKYLWTAHWYKITKWVVLSVTFGGDRGWYNYLFNIQVWKVGFCITLSKRDEIPPYERRT